MMARPEMPLAPDRFGYCTGTGRLVMVDWKRIIVTVGKRIGRIHLAFCMLASAELMAARTIAGHSIPFQEHGRFS